LDEADKQNSVMPKKSKTNNQKAPGKIRIVHILPCLASGGAESALFKLITHMDSTRFENIIITLKSQGVHYQALTALGYEMHAFNFTKKFFISECLKLFRTVKALQADVVQTWLYYADLVGGLVAKAVGVKKIYWNIRCTDSVSMSGRFKKLARYVNALFSYFIPTKIVTNSSKAINFHNQSLHYTKSNWICIPNGFAPIGCEIVKEKRSNIFGMLARYHPDKDYETLLEAIALVKQQSSSVQFYLCGRDLKENLQKRIKLLQLENCVTLFPETETPIEFLKQLDFFVLSSRYESFPNVVGEAMSVGLPCIATDVGVCREVIADTGVIVQAQNAKQLAAACVNFINMDQVAYRELSEKAAMRIKTIYSIEKMVEQYQSLYVEGEAYVGI
jgi:glycosyltransferase involved in cell wall biosynthesis